VALTEFDRQLIRRCLDHEPGAWKDFVERFLGLVYHVIRQTAHMRRIRLTIDEADDIAADVMAHIVHDDFRVLKLFRGKSSLASYLAVVIRRIVVPKLPKRRPKPLPPDEPVSPEPPAEAKVLLRDEVERLLREVNDHEGAILRGIYLEQKSYRELAKELAIPENSIGPILSRLRARLRESLAE
jgi:RNA polymerase sigma-70 factor (ECF subfamily)